MPFVGCKKSEETAGGIIFLGERSSLKRKLAGMALAVAGALLLKP